jgi:hypothetical protein
MNIEINKFTVLSKDLKNVSQKKLQRLKQEWQKSPALGPGKQMAKTWFGLEK